MAGSPLIHELRRPTGMDAYAPSVHLVGEDTVEPPFREPPTGSPVASREEVIAYSRERYTRPRQEVERQIAMLNGWPLPEEIEASVARAQTELTESLKPEDIEKKHIRQRLLRIGVLPEQADLFVVNYELDRIKRQIEWLPSRNAKSPSRYLAAAIAGDYEPPLAVRLRPGSPTEAKPAPVPQVPNPILDSVPEPVDDRLDDISL